MHRGALKLFLKDGPKRGQFTYWVVVTFVLPMCVNKVRAPTMTTFRRAARSWDRR